MKKANVGIHIAQDVLNLPPDPFVWFVAVRLRPEPAAVFCKGYI